MLQIWLGRIVVLLAFYLIRFVPILGERVSGIGQDYLYGPILDDIEITAIEATRSTEELPSPLEIAIRFRNRNDELTVDVSAVNVRVGYSRTGETVYNFLWSNEFHDPPKNIDVPELQTGEAGELELEFVLPDHSAVSRDDPELWIDGSVLLQFGFTLRGRKVILGDDTYPLPGASVRPDRSVGG